MIRSPLIGILLAAMLGGVAFAEGEAVVTAEQFIETLAAPAPTTAPAMRTRSFVPVRTRGIATVARKPPQIAIRIHFKSGATQVADETSRRQMTEAGKAFASGALAPYRFEIAGHTDSVGSDEDNMALSRTRAETLKTYLVETHGIDPARLVARGYGESMPLATNDTPEGRAKNRRVVFKRLD